MPLAERGYYVFPVAVLDQLMKDNGLPTAGEMHAVSPAKLGEITGADAVLYIVLHQYGSKFLLLGTTTSVEVSARLVDSQSGRCCGKARRSRSRVPMATAAVCWRSDWRGPDPDHQFQDRSGPSGQPHGQCAAFFPPEARDSTRAVPACGTTETLKSSFSVSRCDLLLAPAEHRCAHLPALNHRRTGRECSWPYVTGRQSNGHARNCWRRAPMHCTDAELLAVLFGSGCRGASAVDVGGRLLREFGSLRHLLLADRGRCSRRRAGQSAIRPAAGGAGAIAPALPAGAGGWPCAGVPARHAAVPDRAAAGPALRGVLLPAPGQPPPADRLRGAVPRHHRRRQRASARSRAAGAGTTPPR